MKEGKALDPYDPIDKGFTNHAFPQGVNFSIRRRLDHSTFCGLKGIDKGIIA